jgi:sugar diacid utilization regulator
MGWEHVLLAHTVLMAQILLQEIIAQCDVFGVRSLTGDVADVTIADVELLALEDMAEASPDALVIAQHVGPGGPRDYQIDIAVRRAIAAGAGALLLIGSVHLAATARSLAERAAMPVLGADAPPTQLAVFIDRLVRGGAAEAIVRAEKAIAAVSAVGSEDSPDARGSILAAADSALGVELSVVEDPSVRWTDADAVCIGEVAVGRLVPDRPDAAVSVALPVIAAVLSRALQRESQVRFGPARSRSDLIVELLLAESSRMDALSVDAMRAGLPVGSAHAVAWIAPTHRHDPGRRLPASAIAAIELRAFQAMADRAETWHVTAFHDDLVVVASEEAGAADHQRRLREFVDELLAFCASVGGEEWSFTVGLGTPQSGASGLRQSATESRITAETAIASGRLGAVEVTDVTGLRRVLLDFYASPLSRALLDDILAPLDRLGPEQSMTAVRTLLAYLSNRNSLARAGKALTLHPNAVNYRVRRIEQSLGLDLEDPDSRFALELACRLRMMALAP